MMKPMAVGAKCLKIHRIIVGVVVIPVVYVKLAWVLSYKSAEITGVQNMAPVRLLVRFPRPLVPPGDHHTSPSASTSRPDGGRPAN
jgi:hypothetical protein